MKKIGVIGYGSIGKRHADNLMQLGHPVVVYDPNASVGASTDSLEEAINDSDAVVIASPTSMHSQHIRFALDAGKPIFCEKPLADHEVPDTFERVVMVGYNLRFHSCVLKAKEWVDKGFLGQPLWANLVCAQYNSRDDYHRDGVILNWSHEIDLALHLIGPAGVSGCVKNKPESLADIVLSHENDCQSTIHLDYLTVPWIRQSIIVGTKATIILDLQGRQGWLRSSTGLTSDVIDGSYSSFDDDYKDEMETFIARCDGAETAGCTGKEAREALKICLSAKKLSQ